MAVGLQRSGDWLASLRRNQCAVPPANHRCAVCLLPLQREEFRLPRGLKLILHSDLRRRAASRLVLPCPSSLNLFLHRDNSDGNFRTVMAALVQLEYWIRSKRNVRGYVSEFLSNS